MKNKLTFFLILGSFCLRAQPILNRANGSCGTVLQANYLQWRNSIINTQNLVSTLKHDTCLNKKFSIAFHVVLDSNYQWGSVTPASLNGCINSLNAAFSRICVSFEKCYVDVISNYTYNSWDMNSTEALVTPSWNIDNTINVYLADSILGFPAGYCSSVIVLEKASAVGSVPIHEMGHFFGLPHTWNEIGTSATPANTGTGSQEHVRRDNCYTNGDGFCDTEADCYPTGFDIYSPCGHLPGSTDGYGDFFVPPVDNYMTYFGCGCRFTQEQYNFMARVVLTTKLYLH